MIISIMSLIAIMTSLILPPAHLVYLVTRAPHLTPQVVVLSTTQLQLTLELVLPSSSTVNQEVRTKRLPRVSVRDILLQHATTKVQGVILAQLAAYAVNDNVKFIVEMPCEGIGQAGVLGTR
jgi:hypothetical protein